MKSPAIRTPLALAILAASAHSLAEDATLTPVTVEADFRQTNVQAIPEAVTVVGSDDIDARNAEHLEQILSFAPNVNFSSGASRGRYFQIRGIGERSQFIDPVNPSVGLVIDGIDMTGLGAAATLFDVKQVEILRGPQGTRFGANALAGMINIRSNDPTADTQGYVSARAGNYDSYGLGGAISGSLNDSTQGRLAIQQYQSDGYIDNTHLNRDDTNNIDELVARGKLAIEIDDSTDLGLTYLFADVDNGYDAFSLDNTRETLSDEPGVDAQETHAIALNLDKALSNALQLQADVTYSQSDVEYSYDEDWSFVGIAPGWEYSSFDQYLRTYDRQSADFRLLSGPEGRILNNSSDWVAGIYAMQRNEDLTRNYTYLAEPFASQLESSALAVYGELTSDLSDTQRLIIGARVENWENTYEDSNGISGATDETLVSAKITMETLVSDNHLGYTSLARGYKAGGINTDPDISEENREFDAEFNYTLEIGLKSMLADDTLQTRVAAFYIERIDQQVKSSYAVLDDNGQPVSFQDYLANAAKGINYGLELEASWDVSEALTWDLSYGYLNTEFVDYTYETDGEQFSKNGREQAHAPNHSAATAVTIAMADALSLRLEAEYKDAFYFSDSHDERSSSYSLIHAQLAYEQEDYALTLYGRNLTDEDTQVRGFGGFGNDPRKEYAEEPYYQYGEPLTFGLEGKLYF